LREIAEAVLGVAQADQTEVVISTQDEYLTRFAANEIHQNVAETQTQVRVRSILGKRIGVATANDSSETALADLVRNAETAAGFQQENPDFLSLPEPQSAPSVEAYCESTASYTPEDRADGVGSIVRQAKANGLEASGAFSTGASELFIANSLGTRAYHRGTSASVMSVIMGETGSGYAADAAQDVGDVDAEEVGRIAVDKALRSANPEPIEPGEYTVILEEAAVANMAFFLGLLGLGAQSVQEGRSFLCGRFGEKVTGEAITIRDDGLDLRGTPLPFDFEGVPRQKLTLIEQGVGREVAYDSLTAGKEGKASTGHALAAPNRFGPVPIHLFMEPGSTTIEEMIASTERGIWVTRFHYTNPVHPVKTILTGMTRDGTFLIENGKVTKPLKNLRFTQSILGAFENVEALGKTSKAVRAGFGGVVTFAPVAKIGGFRFTGATEF
jgi:predicted Zn-dependent protease